MTNEEKINEIGNSKPINWISNEDLCTYQQGLRRGAFEMAEWKDKCLQTVIDGIKDFYLLDGSAIFICDLIEQRYKDKFK